MAAGGGNQKDVATCGNPENKHLLLIFRVEGGGGGWWVLKGGGGWWVLKGGGNQKEGLGGDGWCASKSGGGDPEAEDVLNPENKHECFSLELGG